MRTFNVRPVTRPVIFIAVVCLWSALAIALKVSAANAGAYTSDLYDYHQGLRSTVEGSFFRSYIYGNVMGDHGYLVLLLAIPVYLISAEAGFWLLVTATPLVMASSAILLRTILAEHGHPRSDLLAGSLLIFPGIWWLTHEPIYGFHPDTLAAPLLALMATGFGADSRKRGTRIAFIAFIAFALLKEETAVLATIFAIPFILKPGSRRMGVALAAVGSVTALMAFGVMALSVTPFNRGNSRLITAWLEGISPWPGLYEALPQLLPVAIAAMLATAMVIFWRKRDPVATGVGLVVAAKIASLALVWQHLPGFSWHLAIPLAGAWLLAFRFMLEATDRARIAVAFSVLVAGAACVDGLWLVNYRDVLRSHTARTGDAEEARESFLPHMEDGVVSVPLHDFHAWRDHPSTVLPRGVTMSPRGISDYVVTETGPMPAELLPFRTCLDKTTATQSRILYSRTPACPFSEERRVFDHLVGLP